MYSVHLFATCCITTAYHKTCIQLTQSSETQHLSDEVWSSHSERGSKIPNSPWKIPGFLKAQVHRLMQLAFVLQTADLSNVEPQGYISS